MNINIAVDNDDILFDLITPTILFHNEVYGTNLKKEDFFSYHFHEVWGGTKEQTDKKILEFLESDHFKNIKPKEGVQNAMKFLKDKGHTLFVVTGRMHTLTQKTEDDIQKYFPGIFSGICFGNNYGNEGIRIKKSILCRRVNSRLILEDDLLHVIDCANAGIKTLVKDYPWNQGILPENAIRFFDWKKAINIIAEYSSKFVY